MKEALNKRKAEFIEDWKKAFPNAAKDILTFIADFKCRTNPHEEEIIEDLFSAGYCYYFALMLKDAFGGEVMYSVGRGHIAWKDTRSAYPEEMLVYDIHGIYADYECLRPVEDLHCDLEGFRHRGHDFDVNYAIEEFKEKHELNTAELNERVFDIIPLKDRLYPFPNGEDTYRYFNIYTDASEYKGYSIREANGNKYRTYKPRPYDDADYYWALTEDKWSWDVYYQGRLVRKCVGTFKEVVEALEEYNSKIKPKMMHN